MNDGLLLIDKPTGITSHDAVDLVRRAVGIRKVGHAGTLDPMATGLLLMGVGRGTRLLRFLAGLPKRYEGTALLGVETDTLDAEGTVVRRSEVSSDEKDLRRMMSALTGTVTQVPPAYSAVKVAGQPLHRAARRGETLQAPPREIEVYSFELRRFDGAEFGFEVRCSSGTYVRSLVAEVGGRLGCGAHVTGLRRTEIGPYHVEEALPPDHPGPLQPLERAVEHLAAVTLQEDEAVAAAHGRILGPAGLTGPYRALGPDGRLIGVYRDQGTKAVPEVILAPA